MEESCSTLSRKRARPKAASSFSNETNPKPPRRRVCSSLLSLFLSNERCCDSTKKKKKSTRTESGGVGSVRMASSALLFRREICLRVLWPSRRPKATLFWTTMKMKMRRILSKEVKCRRQKKYKTLKEHPKTLNEHPKKGRVDFRSDPAHLYIVVCAYYSLYRAQTHSARPKDDRRRRPPRRRHDDDDDDDGFIVVVVVVLPSGRSPARAFIGGGPLQTRRR